MALSNVGVTFVSQNFSTFINNMTGAVTAISNLGRMTQNRLAAINSMNDAMVQVADTTADLLIELTRLEAIDNLNNIMAAGAIASKDFANGLAAINNQSLKLSSSGAGLAKAGQIITGFAAVLERSLGGVFKGISSAAGLGGMIGGLLGTIAPGIGNVLGGFIGSLVGAVAQLTINIEKALFNLYKSIAVAVITFLPKTIGAIVKAGINIAEAVYGFGKTVISSIGKVLNTILSPIKGLFSAIFGAFTGGTGSLGGTIFSSMFKFEVLKQVIRGVISEIKMLAKESFSAAVGLQTLTIRLDNLIAMQIRSARGIDDYGTSIKMASGYTQNLLRWIQKLALATPISVEDISRTVSLSLAMGWTVQSTKELTKAIIDYTATLGMGSEISERIIYNFAQMKQQGKVTGTELRDLGRGAFMPINTILRIMYDSLDLVADGMDKTTISFADFSQQASEGTIPVEKFFGAFVKFVGTAMPDAAYRMNYTFEAVRQNIKDLFGVLLGWNVLGPMIKSITKPLQDFIEMLSTDEALANANAIGKAIAFMVDSVGTGFSLIGKSLGQFFQAMGFGKISIENVVISIIKFGMAIRAALAGISKFIATLIPFAQGIHSAIGSTLDDMGGATVRNINDTRDKANKTFEEMSGDFFTWGANIVISFAEGMITGAASAITAAINYIANLLTSWFVVHSPPKILPDIGNWGMETINEWLHGFTQADFSILNDMQGVIKDALGALVNLGVITDVQSSEEYLSISLDLIQAMDELNRTGTISASIFERLASIGGVFGQEIAELLQLQLDYNEQLAQQAIFEQAVADATRIAEQAQVDYDNAVKATQVSAGKTNNLIREYNKMLRKGADKNVLKDKLKLINLSEIELKAARKAEEDKKNSLEIAQEQLQLAKDALEAFKDALVPLQDAIELQKTLIQTLVDLAQAQKDVETAASGGAGAIEDLGDAIKDLSDTFGGAGGGFEIDFDALKNKAAKEFQRIFDDMKKRLGKAWTDSFTDPTSGFQVALSNLKVAWATTIIDLKSAWDTFAATVQLPSWDEISKAWNAPVPGVGAPGERGRDKEPTSSKSLVQKFRDVIELFTKDIEAGKGGILGLLGRVATYVFNSLRDKLIEIFNNPSNQQAVSDAFNNFMTWVTDLILGKEQTFATTPEGGAVTGTPTPWAERLGTALVEGIKTTMITAIDSIDWSIIITKIGTALYNALFLKKKDKSGNEAGPGIVEGLYLSITDAISQKAPLLVIAIRLFWSTLKFLLGIGSPSTISYAYGGDLVQGLYDGLVFYVTSKWQTARDGLNTFLNNVLEFFGIPRGGGDAQSFVDIAGNIVNGLVNGMSTSIDNAWQAVKDIVDGFIRDIKGFFGVDGTTEYTNPFMNIGKAIIDGIVSGITKFKSAILTAVGNLGIEIPAWLRKLLEASSPSMVFADIGKDMMLGMAEGIKDTSDIVKKEIGVSVKNPSANFKDKRTLDPYKALEAALNVSKLKDRMQLSMKAPMNASPVYGNTVNFGDVHITDNAMSWAVFKAQVQRAIIEG
jgi:tape measure domain-containing protein